MKLRKAGSMAAIVLTAGLVLGAEGCTTEDQSQKQGQESPAEETVGVNQPVQVGDVRWTVTKVEDRGKTLTANDGFTPPKTATGKFVQVHYKVENLGKEMKTTVGVDLEDSKERQFTPVDDGFLYIPQGDELYILDNLNPNVPREFIQIYEVPADATGLLARVGNLEAFGNEVKKIKLGL